MSRPRIWFASLLFAATPLLLAAQTPVAPSTNSAAPDDTTAPVHQGPVVMPPNPPVSTPPPGPTFDPSQLPAPADAPQEQLDDIRPPIFSLHLGFWILLALAALAAVALLVWLLLRRAGHRALDPRTAYELALEELEKARLLLREDEPAPYAVAVSETIRGYLGRRFHTPSTRRTTQEFLRLMQADDDAPLAGHRELLGDFLQACDLVKFARYQPTLDELEQVQDRAVRFVTATRPAPEAREQNGHAR
jgi:hypothetical protein